MSPIAAQWTEPSWTEAGPINSTSAVESGSNSMRVAAVRGRWATRHPARPSASALAQQKEWGRRVREDGLCFESGIEPLYYSQVCAVKSQFRMRLWELQLKTAAGTRCFKNWMYVSVVIMVQFRVVNSWIKRGRYCRVAQFACRVKELCSKNFAVAVLKKTSVVFLSAEGLDWVFRRFTNSSVFVALSWRKKSWDTVFTFCSKNNVACLYCLFVFYVESNTRTLFHCVEFNSVF